MLQGYMECLHIAVEEVLLWWGVVGNAKRWFSSRKPFYMYKKEGGKKGNRPEYGSDHELKYYPPFPPSLIDEYFQS